MLTVSWRTSRLHGERSGRELPAAVTRVVDSGVPHWSLRVVGLAVTLLACWAALARRDSPANPALGVFYVYLWVGLVPLSLVVGNVWPRLSPMRTVHLGLSRLMGVAPERGPVAYPARLGYWPAAAGLFVFVWTELVSPDAGYVSTVVEWALLCAAAMLVGSALFGSHWFTRADPFEVWFGLGSRLSPWGRRPAPDGSRVVWRSPLAGLDTVPVDRGIVALVAVLLGSTAYDSFSASTLTGCSAPPSPGRSTRCCARRWRCSPSCSSSPAASPLARSWARVCPGATGGGCRRRWRTRWSRSRWATSSRTT